MKTHLLTGAAGAEEKTGTRPDNGGNARKQSGTAENNRKQGY